MAKILYSFKYNARDIFTNVMQDTYIFEIKYTNIPDTEPRHKRYQWFTAGGSRMEKLIFDRMEPNIRYFKENLILNIDNMTYQLSSNCVVPINTCQVEDNEIIMEYLDRWNFL